MKIFKRFATLFVCLALALGIAACGNSITFVDFENETVTVEAGSQYTVENPAILDTEGNSYEPTYTVATSGGDPITVIDSRFTVSSLGGYVITYTIAAGGQNYTKTLTINVTDSSAPQIRVENTVTSWTTGVPNPMPSITAYDAVDGNIKPDIAVTFGGSPVSVSANQLVTPEAEGEYVITINAEDSRGNKAETVTVSIYAFNPLEENQLTAFSTGADELTNSIRSSFTNIGCESGWEAVFEGRSGVAWQTAGDMNGAKSSYAMSFNKTAAELTEFMETYTASTDYIAIDLYIDSDDAVMAALHSGVWKVPGDSDGTHLIQGKTWTRVYMPVTTLLEQMPAWGYAGDYLTQYTPAEFFVTQTERATAPYGAYFIDNLDEDYKIYFDQVGFYRQQEVTLDVQPATVALGAEKAFEYTLGGADAAGATLVITDPDGEIVTATETTEKGGKVIPEKVGTYTFTFTAANGCDAVIKKVQCSELIVIDYTEVPDTHIGATVTVPTAVLFDNDAQETIDAAVSAAVSLNGTSVALDGSNQFLVRQSGEYTVTYTANYNEKTYTATDTFTVVEGTKFVIADFNDPSVTTELNGQTAIRGGQAGYATEAIGGRTGVAWMTESSDDHGNTFSLGYSCDIEVLRQYINAGVGEYFTLWVYVDADGQFELPQYDDYFAAADAQSIALGARTIEGKTWTKVYISGEAMFGNVAWVAGNASDLADMVCGQLAGDVGLKLFNIVGGSFTSGKDDIRIYFDEFAIEAGVPVGISADKQEANEGDTVTLTITNPLEAAYTVQVKTPEGDTLQRVDGMSFKLENGVGDYVFVLTVDGAVSHATAKVVVKPAPGTYEIRPETAGTATVGQDYTLPVAILYDLGTESTVADAVVTIESVTLGEQTIAIFDTNKVKVEAAGTYTVNYTCTYNGQTITGSTTFTAIAAPVVEGDTFVIADFNDSAVTTELNGQTAIRGGQAGYATAEEETAVGREGVAWMTESSEGQGFTFSLGYSCDVEALRQFLSVNTDVYFTLWVYIDGDGQFELPQYDDYIVGAGAENTVFGVRTIEGKTWTQVYISGAAVFGNAAWVAPGAADLADMVCSQLSGNVGLKLFNVVGGSFTSGQDTIRVYMDDFAVEAVLQIGMDTDKDSYTVGETATLTVSNPEEAEYSIQVKAPGAEMLTAVTEGEYTFEGAGDYVFVLSMNDRVQTVVLTVSVAPAQ